MKPLANFDEHLPEFDALGIVDVEHSDSGTAGLCPSDKYDSIPFEMALPQLPSGIKESDDLIRQRVPAAEIGALMEVATVTAPAPIVGVIGSAMLPGNYVFDMKRGRGGRDV